MSTHLQPWITPGLIDTLGEIIDAAIAIARADFGNIQLIDADGRLRIVAQRNLPQWWVDYWDTDAQVGGACGAALAAGGRVFVEDVESSLIFVGTPSLDVQLRAGIRAVQSTPLLDRNGRCRGVFSTHFRKPQVPDAHILQVLDRLAAHAVTLIENAIGEQLLRENEFHYGEAVALLESVTSGTNTLVATVDLDCRYTYFNGLHQSELLRLTGKKTALGMCIAEVLSDIPEQREKAMELWQRALSGECVEQRILFGDPSRYCRWYETRHAPILGTNGQIIGAGEVTNDITDRVATEQILRATENALVRQRALFESTVQANNRALAILDTSFKVVWANDVYPQIVRVSSRDLIGSNIFTHFPCPGEPTLFQHVLEHGEPIFFSEVPCSAREPVSRDVTYWDWSLAPVMGDGNVVTALVYSLHEITSHYRTKLALAASEQRYRALVEQVPDGIFVADAAGRYLDVNETGATMLRYSRDEVLTLSIADVISPDSIDRLPNEIARFDSGKVVRSEWNIRRKDGTLFLGEVLGRRLPDGRLQGVLRDITERRQLEDERLASITRQRDVLVREVHHRIKNHLQGMIGLLDVEASSHPTLAIPLANLSAQMQAIASVHGLQALKSSDEIELGELIGSIVKSVNGPTPVQLDLSSHSLRNVSETVAVSMALVVNELVTNAQKHTMYSDVPRPVSVRIIVVHNDLQIEVRNGPAMLPEGFDFDLQQRTGIGLELVGTLLGSIGSSLSFTQQGDEVVATVNFGRSTTVSQ